ncbi:MAG: SRPBCC family protein [Actinomycetota bacterium]
MTRDVLLGSELHADAARVIDALTTKEGLSSFWTSESIAEPAVGSEARFGFEGAPVPLRMRVDRIEPDEVAWTCLGDFPLWEETTVTWSLSPEAEHGGTRVLFRHAGFPDEQPEWEFASIASTWAGILARLKVLAETGTSEPYLG